MDKEEILEKNREDFQRRGGVDERFLHMQWHAGYVMVAAMMVVWLVLFLWNFAHGLDTKAINAIMFAGIATMGCMQFYRYRLKAGLFCGLVAGSVVVFNLVQYMLGTM